ncbi:MAG: O-antigen ligase family protein [Flavobacteriaceae bacterium]
MAYAGAAIRPAAPPLATLRACVLAFFVASGFFVIVEPSPYEATFTLALVVFVATGLSLHAAIAPMVLLLVTFNIGGLFAVIPMIDDGEAITFMAVSAYLAVQAVFFAAIAAHDTDRHLEVVRLAYAAGAVLASLAAITGYFDLGGFGETFTRYGRASGTFKDPNVLGSFLVAPAIFLFQDVVTGRRFMALRAAALGLIVLAIFLSFSRGAWGNLALSGLFFCVLSWNAHRDPMVRLRIVSSAIFAIFGLVALVVIALSVEAIRDLLMQRASLNQSYDVGEMGRFGRQLRALPEILELPLGYGPYRFSRLFGEDPHNVYLNAFAAYGWLGGISYLGLAGATLYAGFRLCAVAGPLRRHVNAFWPPLFFTMVQGLQIDTDHWRHFYLLLGVVWGLHAAARIKENAAAA